MSRSLRSRLLAVAAGVSSVLAPAVPAAAAVPTPVHIVQVTPASGQAVPGQYIVTLQPGTAAETAATEAGVQPIYRYRAVLNGFAARLAPAQLQRLQRDSEVVAIEQDQVVHADTTTTQTNPPSWGLDRVDQRSLPLSGSYSYNTTASQVYAYVIDTGISTSNPDFGGRAKDVYDALGGDGQDCNGHGTHVAGTIGGTTYGIAKDVQLRGVRVLDCSGSGTYSAVIAGMDWVRTNHQSPAVANMSLGGGYSSAVNTAANNLAASGVFLAVAAGNDGGDACNGSPASAADATTVAASDQNDNRASFSDYGGCVDLYAPGVSITSDWLNGGTNTISGTSMATPHVTGVAALYKATYGDAPYSTIRSWLDGNATANVIGGNPAGTPNLLLYKGSL